MILKKLLNLQALKLIKSFKKENNGIFDIVIYGSAIRDKADFNDLDISIIFSAPVDLNKKLQLSQELRYKLKNILNYDLDVKGIDLNDLSDPHFLARKAIIAEGFSVLKNKFLHELFGFNTYYLFSYSLKNLTNSKKVMIHYALHGRREAKGLMELFNSAYLGKGVIKVPLQYSEEFKELFEKNKINYKITKILCY